MKRVLTLIFLSSAVLWVPANAQAGEEFYGVIEKRPEGKAGTWMIGGREVAVTEKTKLEEDDGPLAVGACVEVEYEGNAVEEIESEEPSKCKK
ncbi:DUF5666 domain-containing protein [Methylocaldum sp.]|uniref:DUF5666 domain-containing protein n=1 Tax=Methylocaldum sp. TaxID=1969727 RepID=UPI002D727245|nr:DUF5666 domain-containing protein [Methylocaldum sp.]HYE37763.1 DUF5666 domain-containing protein [Methylocaldum sp.]